MKEFVNLNIDEKFIEESIVQEVFIQSGHKTTICVLILNTGHEVVGTFTAAKMPMDVKEGKDKARQQAVLKIEEYFIQLNSWRLAIYTSEKRMLEQEQEQAPLTQPSVEVKPTPAPKKKNLRKS